MSGPIPAVVAGLCDDAAVFPPGLAPLPDAVRAYRDRSGTWYAGLVGPLVLTLAAVPKLGPLLPDGFRLPLSVTLPEGPAALPDVRATVTGIGADLRSVEIAVPETLTAGEFFGRLDEAAWTVAGADVYVEVPRDERRDDVVARLRGRYRAKFRTGGVRAEMYPDEAELADALAAVVAAGVPFKATAGLHHAIRNTDPETGFEQHGFLNVLLATDALLAGRSATDARAVLAERGFSTIAGLVAELGVDRARATRAAFTSFGTCSITEPLTELVQLGVITTPETEGATT